MTYKIDFSIATSEQIERALSERLTKIRLTRNITQAQLARESGVSINTIRRFENGLDISLDTFIRILIALKVQENFQILLPDPSIRPIERVQFGGTERKRARTRKRHDPDATWVWGDELEKRK
jgi:transcriptional regulator with XRE-family HTH domain